MVVTFMEWRPSKWLSCTSDTSSRRSCVCSLLLAASLPCLLLFVATAFLAQDNKEKLLKWGLGLHAKDAQSIQCKNQCMPPGSETLPKGIISNTTNLEMRPLWGFPKKSENTTSLFAVAVGIKQKMLVDKMVRKFLSSGFIVMLFHYDGVVDEWRDLDWSDRVIHVSAANQTKWWFAKRFLHPDIVAEYDYIFLWDEDIDVENFHPQRYLEIVKGEGLEISQPALEGGEVHHQITARSRRNTVHRRIYKFTGKADQCDGNSMSPPCTGWIELMAPVFSKASWRCVWYMIQNDLIHAWGLDIRLGHCAQGDRTKNIGVVDSEYVVHYGLPTLGGHKNNINLTTGTGDEPPPHVEPPMNATDGADNCDTENDFLCLKLQPLSKSRTINHRVEIRRQSYREFKIFKRRWKNAIKKDECWVNPYPESIGQNIY